MPDVAFGVFIMMGDKLLERCDQRGEVAKTRAANGVLGEVPKEAFHQIEPGGAGGGKMDMKAGMFPQPGFDLGMFVGGVIVANDMQSQIGRGLLVNRREEFDPFLMSMSLVGLRDDLAGYVV